MEIAVRRAPEQLAALSAALSAAENRDLRRELTRGLTRATKPMQRAAKARMAARLPRRGGLARRASSARMSTKARRGREAGVSIVATGRAGGKTLDMQAIDSGLIRHPVFGNRRTWVLQRVNAYTVTDGFEEAAPQARREVQAALDEVAAKIDNKVRRA